MANQAYFPMLPKLKPNAAVNPDKASVWEEESYDFLHALVKSLAVTGDIEDIGHIDSIPDVWARPLLFQMALYDEQGTGAAEFIAHLHDRVAGEWRALLAMIALKDIRHIDLTAESVHLESDTSSLAQVLKALAPKESIDPETHWTDISVLKFQGVPIGTTSPTTLVSAAADYQSAFGGQLPQPWSKDGKFLCDPLPYLTGEEAAALAYWLDRTYDFLRALPGGEGNDAYLSLLRVLRDYHDAAAARAQGGRTYDLADSSLETNSRAFRCLRQMVKGRKATAEDSAVRLVPSEGRTPGHDVLLVSPAMVRDFAEGAAVPAAQLVVWPGLSANDITDESLAGDSSHIGAVTLAGAVWQRPEDFFLDRLTFVRGNALLQSPDIEGMVDIQSAYRATPILPIREELLEIFTPEDIAQRISFDNSRDDAVRVSFRFPLSGANGVTEYRYTRAYSKAGRHDTSFLQSTPAVEIWPDFRRAGWSKYYLYYENNRAEGHEELDHVEKNQAYFEPWAYGRTAGVDVPAHGLVNRYTARLDGFPEALACSGIPSGDDAGGAPAAAGFHLLKAPRLASAVPELSWDLGIDFGTSSTMLYCRENDLAPQPLSFEPHLCPVTESKELRLKTFINFIPSVPLESGERDGSFLSIFHTLSKEGMGTDGSRPLQDGHIFLLNTKNTEAFKQNQQRIDANLKWADDATGRRKVAMYIKQLCLQSLAEAAAKGVERVTWNFSYPTAFSKEQQFAFRQTCEEAVREAYEGTCFAAPEDDLLASWPESKASAYHFNKLGGSDTNFGDGAICLDIGAGTTDVSVISGQPGRIVYHTSIQFAGRFLFWPIYASYQLFARELPDLAGAAGDKRDALIDADMRANSETYLKNLKNHTGKREVKDVLQTAQFGMAGIFYYLGGLLKELHEKGVYAEDHVPDVFVGGNGSRIFSWLSGGAFAAGNPFLQVFEDMLVTASGLKAGRRTAIHLSSQPKIEVAAGMIEERPQNDDAFFDVEEQAAKLFPEDRRIDDFILASVMAGDVYRKGDEMETPETFLSAYDISAGIQVPELPVLRRFFQDFDANHHIWSEGIGDQKELLLDIEKKVNSYYVSETGKDVKKIYVEPVFIMGLKKAMEVLSRARH